jgi:tetratricopeptide (TPR) repeat protein
LKMREDRITTPQDKVKLLATEADAALSEVQSRLLLRQSDQEPYLLHLVEGAIQCNARYQEALFDLLQDKNGNNNQPHAKQHQLARGILMAMVGDLWLKAKLMDTTHHPWEEEERHDDALTESVHKLATMWMPSGEKATLPSTRHDNAISVLKAAWPFHHCLALDAFCHQWNVTRWVKKKPRHCEEIIVEDNDNMETTNPAIETLPATMTRQQPSNTGAMRQELDVKASLFEALKIHDKLLPQGRQNITSLQQKQQAIRKRGRYLEQAVQINNNSQLATRLQCLILASDQLLHDKSSVSEKTLQKFHECFPTVDQDSALVHVLGCLLVAAREDVLAALTLFQKALEKDPSRLETIFNVAQCFWHLGETQRAILFWKHLLLRQHQEVPRQDSRTVTSARYCLVRSDPINREELLWHLFQSASLCPQLVETMLMAADGLTSLELQQNHEAYANVAQTFAWLQTGRSCAALAVVGILPNPLHSLHHICSSLCEMDAKLELESDDIAMLSTKCHQTLQLFEHNYNQRGPISSAWFQQLQTILYNNLGAAHVMDDNVDEAIRCFQMAAVSLEASYNLTLLNWRQGRMEQAVAAWSRLRGFSMGDNNLTPLWEACWQKLAGADIEANVSLHVSPWTLEFSKNRQVLLMDGVILQSVIERQQYHALGSWTTEMFDLPDNIQQQGCGPHEHN